MTRITIPQRWPSGPARKWARGSALVLITILVFGCSTKGCGDTVFATPTVKVYNRTLTTIPFGDAWVLICDKELFDLARWPTAYRPQISPPPGAAALSVDLGVPSDYKGDVSVIVSDKGVQVIRGDVDEGILPPCAGVPPA
jgi:hypothetical protein